MFIVSIQGIETGQFLIAVVVLWMWFIMTVLLYGGLYSNTGADSPNGERCVSERSSGTQENVLKLEETKEVKEITKPPPDSNKNQEDVDNYYRVDSTPEETGNLPFLENYRNPCWKELNLDRTESLLRCLPHFFLVGAPKCGTTDLFKRLQLHPLVSTNVRKEQHWLTRKRFLLGIPKKICSPAVCKEQTQDRGQTLSNYLKYFEKAIDEDIAKTEENDFHPMIFGDCSASVFWDNQCLLCPFKDNIDATPPYTNADIVHNIVPNAKIMIMIRDPVKRLFSDYLYFRDTGKSVQTFHDEVAYSIKQHEKCLLKHSDRYCAYFMDASLRMQIGFYHIYIEDYLRVFPREQILIMRLEEYSKRLNESITEVFTFLEIGVPPEEIMSQICEVKPAETKSVEDEKIGEMLPETFELLTEFYRPYNEKLVELLGDDFKY